MHKKAGYLLSENPTAESRISLGFIQRLLAVLEMSCSGVMPHKVAGQARLSAPCWGDRRFGDGKPATPTLLPLLRVAYCRAFPS